MIRLPRNAQIWLPGYVRSRVRDYNWHLRRCRVERVWLMIADHYEPFWRNTSHETARSRVAQWVRKWPQIAAANHDAANRPPKYTFFYPAEEYRPDLLDPLADMTRSGIADVEVHLHHDGGSQQDFVDRINAFTESLHQRHGLLRKYEGQLAFGFIHGNWALDNSRPDGRWCGLNNEISLLRNLGCYADFTMPSGPSPTQARLLNTIYWAIDDPDKPKSYDTGVSIATGNSVRGDLLMIPGPFGLRWTGRLLPRIETGEVAAHDLPTPYRVRRWLDLAPRIGKDRFLKLYTHGAQEKNMAVLLGGGLERLYQTLKKECQRRGVEVYFVSAWEMFQAVRAAVHNQGPASY